MILPKPSQVLYTRNTNGEQIKLLIIGKPFAPAEISHMKFEGGLDTIKQIFTPAVKISKGSEVATEDAAKYARSMSEMRDSLNAATKTGDTQAVREAQDGMAELRRARVQQLRSESQDVGGSL